MGELILFKLRYRDNKKTHFERRINMYEKLIERLRENQQGEYSISDAEKIADEILILGNYFDINGPIPILKIAKEFDFVVFKEKTSNDNVSGNIFIGGTTKKVYGQDKVIVVGDEEEYYHQRFIIAHELAHYLMDYIGKEISKTPAKLFSEAYIKSSHKSEKEIRADRFAAELLMPGELFLARYCKAMEKSCYNKLYTIAYLSEYFETKKTCIERRIQEVIG